MIFGPRSERDDRPVGLLVEACRHASDLDDEAPVAALEDPVLRRQFLELAVRNGVAGVVLASLERRGILEALPDPAARDLGAALATLRRRAGFWVLERDRVLRGLSQWGLEPVTLKGAALCTAIFREPVERSFGDLDLLFADDEARDAIRSLETLGYRSPSTAPETALYLRHHYHLPLRHRGGFVVEVHWALTRGPGPGSDRLDARRFLDDAVRVRELRMPCPEHLLLHAASQINEDRFPRMCRFVDVDRLVRRTSPLDWDRISAEARAGGQENALAFVLDTSRRLLRTPVPDSARDLIRASPATRWHLGLFRVEDALRSPRFAGSWSIAKLLSFWLSDGARERLGQVRALLRGTKDPMRKVWNRGREPVRTGRWDALGRLRAICILFGIQAALSVQGLTRSLRIRSGDRSALDT